jgi:O-antigen ligase
MALVSLRKPLYGAYYIAFMSFCLMLFNAFRRDRYQLVSVTIGCIPVIVLLRGLAFYHGITTLLVIEVLIWCFMGSAEIKKVAKDVVWVGLLLSCIAYWWISFIRTGDYYSNSRVLDFGLAVTAIYLLAQSRIYLASAFVGIALSTTAFAVGLLPIASERLGMARIDGIEIGNPVLLGVPAAFVVLLCFAENGRWLLLEHKPVWRMIICIVSGQWLILSGSRGSWTVAILGLFLILIFGKQDRKPILLALGVALLAALAMLSTERGSQVLYQYDRSVDGDRSLANRTSGRSLQWEALPKVFVESPLWGWGPGSGREVVETYTGHSLEWHALYLQIIAETGLIGFYIFLGFLGIFFYRSILHLRRYGEIAPIIGLISFMTLGLSVQALDAFSGVLVGMVFLPLSPVRRYVFEKAVITVSEPASRRVAVSR